jgi:hypothetical protein
LGAPRYTWQGAPDPDRVGEYRPLFDEPFDDAALQEWLREYERWKAGTHPDQDESNRDVAFSEWNGGPPDPRYYRPEWRDEDATWYQVYETVTEGTPISPPFSTQEELIEWLCTHQGFSGFGLQRREAAERIVRGG